MTITLGQSVEGRPIEADLRGPVAAPGLLIFGGFHGDEPKGVTLAQRLIAHLRVSPNDRGHVRWAVVPLVNPDGYQRRRRRNAHGVDINRNFPTRNWSPGPRHTRMFGGLAPAAEPETQAVIRAVTRFRPHAIITIHSISHDRHCNNYDGPARRIASILARHNGYPVTASIGYPTPGSFGAWAGIERGIPTITLELPTQHSLNRCWTENREGLVAVAAHLAGRMRSVGRTPPAARSRLATRA